MTWAREVGTIDAPLTVGYFCCGDGKPNAVNDWIEQNVDIVSFHSYGNIDDVKTQVESLKDESRPIMCTEYMARKQGSTFDPILGYFQDEGVWAFNWGLVVGRSQTQYPWCSWGFPFLSEPKVWFHDILNPDGTPHIEAENVYIGGINNITFPASVNDRFLLNNKSSTPYGISWCPLLFIVSLVLFGLKTRKQC